MNKEVEAVLDVLAERFGTTIEMLWAVLIKQAIVQSYVALGFVGMCVLLIVGALILWNYALKNPEKVDELEGVGTALTVVAFFGFLLLPFIMAYAFQRLLNPEFFALKMIMEMF
jgi:hypothetical protein